MNRTVLRNLSRRLQGPAAGMAWVLLPLGLRANDAESGASPVPAPPAEHFSRLWQESLFTSRKNEPQGGPSFVENFHLAGIYEVDGRSVAVVVDKSSSTVTEIDSKAAPENGLRLVRVEPGGTPDQTRVLLQKGAQSGWVRFPDPALSSGRVSVTPISAAAIQDSQAPLAAPGQNQGRPESPKSPPPLTVPDIRGGGSLSVEPRKE